MSPIRELLLEHRKIAHPDEFFFPSLAFNPHLQLPGACLDSPTPPSEAKLAFLARYVVWSDTGIGCPTKYIRGVCILGSPHISQLQKVPHLIANKFHANFHPEAYDAMEKWYFEKIEREILTGVYASDLFDPAIYANRICSFRHL